MNPNSSLGSLRFTITANVSALPTAVTAAAEAAAATQTPSLENSRLSNPSTQLSKPSSKVIQPKGKSDYVSLEGALMNLEEKLARDEKSARSSITEARRHYIDTLVTRSIESDTLPDELLECTEEELADAALREETRTPSENEKRIIEKYEAQLKERISKEYLEKQKKGKTKLGANLPPLAHPPPPGNDHATTQREEAPTTTTTQPKSSFFALGQRKPLSNSATGTSAQQTGNAVQTATTNSYQRATGSISVAVDSSINAASEEAESREIDEHLEKQRRLNRIRTASEVMIIPDSHAPHSGMPPRGNYKPNEIDFERLTDEELKQSTAASFLNRPELIYIMPAVDNLEIFLNQYRFYDPRKGPNILTQADIQKWEKSMLIYAQEMVSRKVYGDRLVFLFYLSRPLFVYCIFKVSARQNARNKQPAETPPKLVFPTNILPDGQYEKQKQQHQRVQQPTIDDILEEKSRSVKIRIREAVWFAHFYTSGYDPREPEGAEYDSSILQNPDETVDIYGAMKRAKLQPKKGPFSDSTLATASATKTAPLSAPTLNSSKVSQPPHKARKSSNTTFTKNIGAIQKAVASLDTDAQFSRDSIGHNSSSSGSLDKIYFDKNIHDQ